MSWKNGTATLNTNLTAPFPLHTQQPSRMREKAPRRRDHQHWRPGRAGSLAGLLASRISKAGLLALTKVTAASYGRTSAPT